MTCSDGLRKQIPLRDNQKTLQEVRTTEWMHSPKS